MVTLGLTLLRDVLVLLLMVSEVVVCISVNGTSSSLTTPTSSINYPSYHVTQGFCIGLQDFLEDGCRIDNCEHRYDQEVEQFRIFTQRSGMRRHKLINGHAELSIKYWMQAFKPWILKISIIEENRLRIQHEIFTLNAQLSQIAVIAPAKRSAAQQQMHDQISYNITQCEDRLADIEHDLTRATQKVSSAVKSLRTAKETTNNDAAAHNALNTEYLQMSAAFKKSSRETDNTQVLPSHREYHTTIAPLRAALQTALMGGTSHSPVASRAGLSNDGIHTRRGCGDTS